MWAFCNTRSDFHMETTAILRTVAQTSINHIIFWKSVMRTFKCIYLNCFSRLRFLAEVRTKLQKINFKDNLRAMTQKENVETRQMTPFFIYFFQSVTFIFVFENCQNSFLCGLPFGPFWSVKYLSFGLKLPISKVHLNFLESRHLEVTKNPNYSLSPEGSPKKVSAHVLISKFGRYKNSLQRLVACLNVT